MTSPVGGTVKPFVILVLRVIAGSDSALGIVFTPLTGLLALAAADGSCRRELNYALRCGFPVKKPSCIVGTSSCAADATSAAAAS